MPARSGRRLWLAALTPATTCSCALHSARAARAETERTPLVPLVSIRELHEDFSGKVEDAECARKPELVNAQGDQKTRVDAFANLESLLDAATVECDPLPPDSSICAAPVFGDETPCFCLESPEDDWRCSVRYSDDDCTPDSDDECGDEDRRI